MFIIELIKKIKFDLNADRIGPDIPFTHWKLFFKNPMLNLCKRKFKSFGNNSEFRAGAYAIGCSNIEIGSRVVIRPGAMLFAEPKEEGIGIKIEDDVLIGSGVHIYTGNHCFDRLDIPIIDQGHSNFKEVVLKKGCWISANVIILAGVTIGKNSVVAAGSVVTKSVSDGVVVAGVPAKIIKHIGKNGI